MNKILNKLYSDHSSHEITFNQNVVKSIGLQSDLMSIKCGDLKLPVVLYSSSMVSSKIVLKLTRDNIYFLKEKKYLVTILFSFNIETEKNSISFYVNSKIKSIEAYSDDKPDVYFSVLEFTKRAPNDLIQILGTHLDRQQNMHKRAEKRYVLKSDKNLSNHHMENFLFISGKGKKCILTEISMFSAKVIIMGKKEDYVDNSSVMLLIKFKDLDGIGEMVGNISRVDIINNNDDLLSIIIIFNQEVIPPTYKLWIAEFIEMIDRKALPK